VSPTGTLITGRPQTQYFYWYAKDADPLSASDPNYRIYVRDSTDDTDSTNPFELTAVDTPCGRVRITWIGHHENTRYVKKGISPAVIAELARLCGKPVISSKKDNPHDPTDRRSDDADGVWIALKDKELAFYDAAEDRYQYVGPATPAIELQDD
jgi:hypothetical protein